jgi:hypothetical protein
MNKKNNLKIIIIAFLILLVIYCFFYNARNNSSYYSNYNKTTLVGILVKNDWSKSIDSYCAQSSNYFSIKTNSEELVLEFEPTYSESQMVKFADKNVTVVGEKILKKIECKKGEQCPVTPNDVFSCEILKVDKISNTQ